MAILPTTAPKPPSYAEKLAAIKAAQPKAPAPSSAPPAQLTAADSTFLQAVSDHLQESADLLAAGLKAGPSAPVADLAGEIGDQLTAMLDELAEALGTPDAAA